MDREVDLPCVSSTKKNNNFSRSMIQKPLLANERQKSVRRVDLGCHLNRTITFDHFVVFDVVFGRRESSARVGRWIDDSVNQPKAESSTFSGGSPEELDFV